MSSKRLEKNPTTSFKILYLWMSSTLPPVTLVKGQLWIQEHRLISKDGNWKPQVPGLSVGMFKPQRLNVDAENISQRSDTQRLWRLADAALDSAAMLRLTTDDGMFQVFDVRSDFSNVRSTVEAHSPRWKPSFSTAWI